MGHSYTPSQCILSFIILSTVATVLLCLLCGVLLFIAPEEPSSSFSGTVFTLYPALGFLLSAFLAAPASLLGCWALWRDSKGLLLLFSVCAVIVAGLELASGGVVFAFTYTGEIKRDISNALTVDIVRFSLDDNTSKSALVNELQREYQCCGINNYSDWRSPDLNTTWSRQTGGLELAPQSCCKQENINWDNCTTNSSTLYNRGCMSILLGRMKLVVDCIFAVGVVAGALEVLTSCMSCYGAWLIRKYEQYDIL